MRRLSKPCLVIVGVAVALGFSVSSAAHAQDPIKTGNLGTGVVIGVTNDGKVKPVRGDKVELTFEEHRDDKDKDLGYPKGKKHPVLVLTTKDRQAFIAWEASNPAFEKLLIGKAAKLTAVEFVKISDFQRGDKVTIQAQRKGDDLVDVTFTIVRGGGKGSGLISFDVRAK